MKTTAVLLLFVFSITKLSLFGIANAANEPVLDIDGDELRTGVEYYVVSAIWGAGGGGLALAFGIREKCPEIVVQRRSGDDGIPVIISNADGKDGEVVRLSSDVNIEFIPLRPKLCLTTTVWKLDNYDNSAGKWWVTTDGVKGNPGPNTLTSWFKLEKAGEVGYKLRFCPSVCDSCTSLCSDIGKYGDEGVVRLALSSESGWPWIFKKASTIKQVVNGSQ